MIDFFNYVGNNFFLKKIYPDGIKNVGLQKIVSQVEHPVWFYLNVYDQPVIEIKKYGAWGKDYNGLILEFTIQSLKKTVFNNLYRNNGDSCFFEFNITNDLLNLNLFGQDKEHSWNAEIISDDGFIFQSASPFLINKNSF
ncbi:hypothetical protein [Ignatzschineria sp. LJL83]